VPSPKTVSLRPLYAARALSALLCVAQLYDSDDDSGFWKKLFELLEFSLPCTSSLRSQLFQMSDSVKVFAVYVAFNLRKTAAGPHVNCTPVSLSCNVTSVAFAERICGQYLGRDAATIAEALELERSMVAHALQLLAISLSPTAEVMFFWLALHGRIYLQQWSRPCRSGLSMERRPQPRLHTDSSCK
jgi:hypothetical protein